MDFLQSSLRGGKLLLSVHQSPTQSLLLVAERKSGGGGDRGKGGYGGVVSYGHTPAAAGSCRMGKGAAPDP